MSIRIVAMRHAKPESAGYADDVIRPLSSEGKKTQKRLTQLLNQKGIKPTAILTSPLLRAQQTAEIASELFDVEFLEEPALGNNFDEKVLLKILSSCKPDSTIFLVGHAPTLGEFVNKLTGAQSIPGGLSKSSAAIVDFEGKVSFGTGKLIDYFKA